MIGGAPPGRRADPRRRVGQRDPARAGLKPTAPRVARSRATRDTDPSHGATRLGPAPRGVAPHVLLHEVPRHARRRVRPARAARRRSGARAAPRERPADRRAVPGGLHLAEFALGCFWGAEKGFWQLPGVWVTAVGYQGGFTPNATYQEACSGRTGHAEAVRVAFDPAKVGYEELLKHFWEAHDPTQGMRQGNDVGTQYRSAIFPRTAEQRAAAMASRDAYQERLTAAGFGAITTEINGPPAPDSTSPRSITSST